MIQNLGKYVAMRSVNVKGGFLPRGIIVEVTKIAGRTIVDACGAKYRITGVQFRHDFIQYAVAATIAAESQAVR